MKKKTRLSLKLKFTLLIVSLIITLLLLSSLANINFITDRIKLVFTQSFINDTVKLVDYFSQTIYDGLKTDDDILLINTFDQVKNMTNVEYAVLFNRDREVRYHSEVHSSLQYDPERNRVLKHLFLVKGRINIYPPFRPDKIKSTYLISRTYYDENDELLGMLLVKYSTANLRTLLRDIRSRLMLILLVILGVSIVISIFFSIGLASLTVRPINVIAEGTEIIGEGNYDHVIPIKRSDELGTLADNFNSMTGKIKEAQKVLIEKQKEQEQMQVAKQIQTAIFPPAPILEDEYEVNSLTSAAKTIGGDYHYYTKLDDNNVFFVLADVSGKGVPAALVTFMISTVFQSILQKKKDWDPGHILTEANTTLSLEMSKFGRFATIMMGVYNKQSGLLKFVSGGHGDLFVFRHDKNDFDAITDKGGMPIGVMPEVEYESTEIQILKGDSIAIFTDGVNEARNEAEEEYGEARFFASYKTVAAQDTAGIISHVEGELKAFVGNREQHDDTTLLIFKRKA